MRTATAQGLIEKAARLRGDDASIAIQSLERDANLAALSTILYTLFNYTPVNSTTLDLWAFPSWVKYCDLTVINPNLLDIENLSNLADHRPFYKHELGVDLKYYKSGCIEIPLTTTISSGEYTLSYVTTPDAEEVEVDTFTSASVGSPTVTPTDTEFTVYAYTASTLYPLTFTGGSYKKCAYIQFTEEYDGNILGVLFSIKDAHKVLGGFKMETGQIATPSRTGAYSEIPYLDKSSLVDVLGLTRGLELAETILRGPLPAELGIAHTLSKVDNLSLTDELILPNLAYENAIVWGLCHLADLRNMDGVETRATQMRARNYMVNLQRVKMSVIKSMQTLKYGWKVYG